MNSLKTIREKLGISQEQAAQWLGISRSLATHYELGTRSLPAAAFVKLSKLYNLVSAFEMREKDKGGKAAGNSGKDEKKPDALHALLAGEPGKFQQLHRQLAIYESKHAVLQQQLMLVQHVIDSTAAEAGEKEKLWLNMLYHGINHRISKFDESKQLKLKLKIVERSLVATKAQRQEEARRIMDK
jgi:transcriptional regulator with XRE-family HTH domain